MSGAGGLPNSSASIGTLSQSRFSIAILFAGFVATGAATVLLSPMLPLLSNRWQLSDERAGYLFTCQFMGSIFGTLLSGYLVRKAGLGRILFLGYLFMGVFVLQVWKLPSTWLTWLAFLNGIGLGFVIPATNMAVSDAFSSRRASALSLLNLAWSVGAIACPAALAAAAKTMRLNSALFSIAIGLGAIALLSLRIRVSQAASQVVTRSLATPYFPMVILGMLFFLYIGTEGAVAGWLATYTRRTVLSGGVLWMTAPSFFWAAIMFGRTVAPGVLRRIKEDDLAAAGLVASAVGTLAILVGTTAATVLSGAALSGLGMSVVFPVFIAKVSHIFGENANRLSPYMFAMAGLGGAVIPWVVGTIAAHEGSLQVGLVVALLGIVSQIGLTLALRRQHEAAR